MKALTKKYNTTYKKKPDVDRDTFRPRRAPKENLQCGGCGAFYHRRHWTLTAPTGLTGRSQRHAVLCPACRKTKERRASGEVHLLGVSPAARGELLRILRNEERRAREKNALERIMRMEAADGGWKVETTTEKMALRLGRALAKARGGSVAYKWSHNNKFVRVVWRQEAAGERV